MNYSKLSIIDRCIITTTLLLTMGIAVGFVASTRHTTTDVIHETAPIVTTVSITETTEPTPETTTETIAEDPYKSLGTFKLTAYCACEKCCGRWANNRPVDTNGNPVVYTASQEIARQGITVAADRSLPFNTELIVDGHTYIVQDRGGAVNGNHLDIYFECHESAVNFGVQYKEVFIKEGAV